MILRSFPGPFVAALVTLVFLLLLQFLITHMKDIVGRGLPFGIIVELVSYSLAYMVSLAVPMSLLLATLIVFGRLAESQAYAVAKSSGISLLRLTWPVLAMGSVLVGGMSYYNSVTLPEANHRMRSLWHDIRTSRPAFDLEPGVFFEGLQGYSIRVADVPQESGELRGVLIFDHSGSGEATIVAERGVVSSDAAYALEMTLFDGEIHRVGHIRDQRGRVERYERVGFSQHRLSFDLSELNFERSATETTSRTGRTMRASQLAAEVDSLSRASAQRRDQLRQRVQVLVSSATPPSPAVPPEQQPTASDDPPLPTDSPLLAELDPEEQRAMLTLAVQRARMVRSEIDAAQSTLSWESLRADRYRVEYYKKFSMALACLIFAIVGIPIGLMARRRGYGTAIVAAVAVFLFYWIILVQGEKFADRDLIDPWIGIWSVNIIGGIIAIAWFARESREPASMFGLLRRSARSRDPRGAAGEHAPEPASRA
jgi:lipopolysaccharide export system permease protein